MFRAVRITERQYPFLVWRDASDVPYARRVDQEALDLLEVFVQLEACLESLRLTCIPHVTVRLVSILALFHWS